MLGDLDAELKLVIAGNHDISLDGEYWQENMDEDDDPDEHEEAVALMTEPLAKEAGVTYLTEGRHEFTLRNGTSFSIFVSPYQPECGNCGFGYKRGEDRWQIPEDVEIVMTHGPPKGMLDFAQGQHVGCESLLKAVERPRPLMHCFGHIHEGYGAEMKVWEKEESNEDDDCAETIRISKTGTSEQVREMKLSLGESTLMLNAAIMDEKNKPRNAPWLVELPLEI